MKTFLLFFGVFFAATISAQRLPFGIDGGTVPAVLFAPRIPAMVFQQFPSSPILPNTFVTRPFAPAQRMLMQPEVPYRFRRPDAAVFCRMEDFTAKNYRVMFSLHAGGYIER